MMDTRPMRKLRPEERWAAAWIRAALPDMDVRQHDDGSKQGMHDLNLLSEDGVLQGTVEVSAAAEGQYIKLWKLVNGQGRCIYPDIAGGWVLRLRPTTRAKPLLRTLPQLLATWERHGIREIPGRGANGPTYAQAAQLGIVSADQSSTDFPGSVYFTIDLPREKSGGFVASTGDALALWLGHWLRESGQGDVLSKLATSPAPRRHAFIVFPGFTTAPFEVSDLLMRDAAPLPTIAPDLASEVTDVWAVSTWNSGDGFRWSEAAGWARFAKVFEVDSQGDAAAE